MRETAFYKEKPTHTISSKCQAICFLVHAAVGAAENAETKKTITFSPRLPQRCNKNTLALENYKSKSRQKASLESLTGKL